MQLTENQKRHLRGLAHKRKPVVMIGDPGLTEAVVHELDRALEAHELVKVRVRGAERADRDAIIQRMCDQTRAILVQRIGHVAVLYRPSETPRIRLPG